MILTVLRALRAQQNDRAWHFALWQHEELDEEAPLGWDTALPATTIDSSTFETR